MVKEVEELIKIVGKGNLLETLFIFLGGFQHADLDRSMDRRNHFGLSAFIKKEGEPLDEYFNLKFSLQGLFLIYAQAYKILSENNNLNTKDVIDKIYEVIKGSELNRDINEVVDGSKLDLLNILASPKREPIFKTEEDFENKVLIGLRKLLSEGNTLNKYDREFALNKCVISSYYSIHDIKADKDIALFFSLGGHYKELSSSNKTVKREVLEICENQLIESYIMFLAGKLHMIGLSSKDGTIKYTINHENVDRQEKELKMDGLIYPINTKNTLEQLLKNQNSDEFEQLVTSPKNIYYSVPQEENKCRPNFIVSKKKEKDHKDTVCKLILGMFVLSVGLYVADYFLMEQKLFNPIKSVLPQDNFVNLVIAAVLTVVIVYALFQLSQEPPLSTVDDVQNKKLEPLHAKQAINVAT
ncbi:WD1261 family protein [Wolbachia endosymbiont (group A) of Barypeithes pellucidus]|uniref:WD1261 family protein n=1 Tax=Wolbachia endosymbiont (group A) of Barypeithes pellucidus TaxID=3139322 RepID=UPI003CCA8DE0